MRKCGNTFRELVGRAQNRHSLRQASMTAQRDLSAIRCGRTISGDADAACVEEGGEPTFAVDSTDVCFAGLCDHWKCGQLNQRLLYGSRLLKSLPSIKNRPRKMTAIPTKCTI